jgi:hypothetical protein
VKNIAQNVAQYIGSELPNFNRGKSSRNTWATSEIVKNTIPSKHSLKGRKFAQSGVDVMITIFCNFRQFLTKNWRFSQKPML